MGDHVNRSGGGEPGAIDEARAVDEDLAGAFTRSGSPGVGDGCAPGAANRPSPAGRARGEAFAE